MKGVREGAGTERAPSLSNFIAGVWGLSAPAGPGQSPGLPSREIRALTGLRGVAAVFVMLLHLPPYGIFRRGLIHEVLGHGYLAVDLFFILSGYLMARAYGGDFTSRASFRADYARLLLRRLGRIYPMLVIATLLTFLLCKAGLRAGFVTPAHAGMQLLANLTGTQAWHLAETIDPPCWSISIEFLAYLLLPALLIVTLRHSRALALACYAAAVLALVAVVSTAGPGVGLNVVAYDSLLPPLRCMAGFVIGLLVFRLSTAHPNLMAGALPPALAIGLTLIAMAFKPTDLLLVALIFPALVIGLAHGTGWPLRLLQSGPVHRIGTWSYSLYLLHYPVGWSFLAILTRLIPRTQIHASWGVHPTWPAMFAAYAVVLATTALAHHTIEAPLMRRLRPGRPLYQPA